MEDYDPIVDPVREVRHQISERFGHDPKRLVEHYMQLDKEDPGQLVGNEKKGLEDAHRRGDTVGAKESAP